MPVKISRAFAPPAQRKADPPLTSRRSTASVPYSATEMFNLVADVERYPEFLPWCSALRVIDRRVDGDGEILNADMVVAYSVFREKFRSLVRLDRTGNKIDVSYVEGPFRTLKNIWTFADEAGGGSTVDFFISFEFQNRLLQAAAKSVFEKAFVRMSDAFVERAREIYGAR